MGVWTWAAVIVALGVVSTRSVAGPELPECDFGGPPVVFRDNKVYFPKTLEPPTERPKVPVPSPIPEPGPVVPQCKLARGQVFWNRTPLSEGIDCSLAFGGPEFNEKGENTRVRFPDDSDPQMQAVVYPWWRSCWDPARQFKEEALQHGERLAKYLIRQYEKSVEENHFKPSAMWWMSLAATQTDLAFDFLSTQVRDETQSEYARGHAMELLAEERSPRVIDLSYEIATAANASSTLVRKALWASTRAQIHLQQAHRPMQEWLAQRAERARGTDLRVALRILNHVDRLLEELREGGVLVLDWKTPEELVEYRAQRRRLRDR